ncbi:MAG: hypothetical protein RIQ62_1344 [Bacteroidota bacterium]
MHKMKRFNNHKNKGLLATARASLMTLVLLLGVISVGFGQLITINNGSTSGNIPMGASNYHASEAIYLQSELNTAMQINRLNFNCQTLSTVSNTYNMNIYLKTTASSTLAAGTYSLTGYTQVYSGPIVFSAVGWAGVTLTTPFNYTNTPGQNLQLLVIRNDGIAHTGNVFYCSTGNAVAGTAALTARRFNGTTLPVAGTTSMTASNFRPAIQIGQVYSSDIAVSNIYTLGKVPIEYGTPAVIKANIINAGLTAMNGINVTLSVNGTNSFTNTQTITSLAAGASSLVTFDPYTPTSLSSGDVITVTTSTPGDLNAGNDSKTWNQDVTPNVYTYKNASLGNNGGVGFTGATGDFVAKFNSHIGTNYPYNMNNPQINEIKVDLTTSGLTYQLGIWDATGVSGTPGTNLWTSPILTSAPGTSYIPVPNVSVNGDYYVGVRQTGTTNIGFAYQAESPIRAGTFFYTSPTGGTAWTDFATSNSAFRFAIEVTVRIPVPPNCAINYNPSDLSVLPCNNPVLSWGSGGGAPTGYDVYFSTNQADVLNSVASAMVASNQPGTTYTPTGLSNYSTYYWKVVPRNVDGPATGCAVESFTTGSLPVCYCMPAYTGTLCTAGISQVDFNTLSNNAACAPPAHAIYTPTGNLTTSVQQGGNYNLNVTTTDAAIISAWIDYNQNGTFDATEWTQVTTSSVANTVSTAVISIPLTALTGNTLMRVRTRLAGNTNGSGDACTSFGSGSSQDYVITITPPIPCAGAPNPGNTLASVNNICPGTVVNFSLQNQTQGTGVSYQWFNNAGLIAGATSNMYSTAVSVADDYYCEVTCSGTTTPSNLISINMANFLNCYCIPTTTNGCTAGDHITNVTVTSLVNPINNTTGACLVNSFSDYTSLTPAQASQGDMVPISVSVNNGGTEYAAGWIDYNQNGVFDTIEYITLTDADGVAPWIYNGMASVPINAVTGITRMRFRSSYAAVIAAGSACATYSYGETEDYLIDIQAAVLCSGTPNPGATVASTNNPCSGQTVSYSLQNATTGSNVTYQWYNIGGAVAGATSAFYNQVATGPDSVYCSVTCPLASPTTGNSVPVGTSMASFMNCYCVPTNAGGACITNVSIDALNHTSVGCSGVDNYNPIDPLVSIPGLTQGNTYTFSLATDAAAIASVWIDYNQNGAFEATEWQQVYTNATTGTITITIPLTAQTGVTGMRVRSRSAGNINGAIDACLSMGSGETEDFAVNILPLVTNTTLNLTCFIQGYWTGSSMSPALFLQGEPTTANACDSIDVELHSDMAPYGVDATVRTVLNQNGTATCVFPVMTGNKYIVVKHRSALQTWSANAVAMSATVNYDFSDADTKAYGSNMVQVSTSPTVWAFFSGDVIVDENMDLLDLGAVESDISSFGYGYLNTDLNGDGNVDLLDSPMLESNISGFIYSIHP